MKKVVFALLVVIGSISYAQTAGSISGKILDSEMYNEPLLMASVAIKDTDWSTQTNFNGNFEITNVVPGKYTLQITFLGYEQLELPIEISSEEHIEVLEALQAKRLPYTMVSEISEKEVSASVITSEPFKR